MQTEAASTKKLVDLQRNFKEDKIMSKILEVIEDEGLYMEVLEGDHHDCDTIIRGKVETKSFIIPNSITRLDGFFHDKTRDRLKKMTEAAGFEVTDSTKFIQIWSVASCKDNIADSVWSIHGYNFFTRIEQLPAELFAGKVEGDKVEFLYKDLVTDKRTGNRVEVQINFEMTLDQLDYRYRRFGRFEEVFKMLGGDVA